MKILTTSATQSIKFIPREAATSVTLVLTNKNTRTSTNVSVGVSNSDGYMTITSGAFSLIEGTNYSMKIVSQSGDVIYRDTIFCTNQTDYDKFDVHKDEYVTEDTYDNEFIVL